MLTSSVCTRSSHLARGSRPLRAALLVTTLSMTLQAFALPPLAANPSPLTPAPLNLGPGASAPLAPAPMVPAPLAPTGALDLQATAALPAVAEATVKSILFNSYGEADGLRLANDVIVKFPPHRSQALLGAVQPGQHVRILGHAETPAMVKADAIINVTTGNIVVDQPPANNLPLLPPHLRAQSLQPLQVEGKVDLILNGPRGEVDGVILDNQSIVHFPPESLSVPLRPGLRIAVAGLGTKTANGVSLEAIRMGSSAATMQPLYAPAAPACQPAAAVAGQC
jgi:hypothetical protein